MPETFTVLGPSRQGRRSTAAFVTKIKSGFNLSRKAVEDIGSSAVQIAVGSEGTVRLTPCKVGDEFARVLSGKQFTRVSAGEVAEKMEDKRRYELVKNGKGFEFKVA